MLVDDSDVIQWEGGMRTMGTAVVLVGIVFTVPAVGFASTRWSDPQSAPTPLATALIATHATKGVVKSFDATSLVITRSAIKRRDLSFVLNPETQRDGQVAVGATVEVRYRTEEKQRVATAIRVQEHLPPATAGKASLARSPL
jgi:hypothetical protein